MANAAETATDATNEAVAECTRPVSENMTPRNSRTAAKPYSCSICPGQFWNTADLTRHAKTAHERVVAWGCAAFTNHDLAFKFSTTDDSHRSGETPIATCVFCGELFSGMVTPAVRQNHLLHAHLFGGCNLQQFYRFDKLQQHLKHFHGVTLPQWTQPWRDAFLLQLSNNTAELGGPSGEASIGRIPPA